MTLAHLAFIFIKINSLYRESKWSGNGAKATKEMRKMIEEIVIICLSLLIINSGYNPEYGGFSYTLST